MPQRFSAFQKNVIIKYNFGNNFLSTATLDKNGLEPLHNTLRRIGLDLNSTDEFDLLYTITKAQRILGKELFFSLSVDPDPYDRKINRISILQPSNEDSAMIPS